jgi:protein JSN1
MMAALQMGGQNPQSGPPQLQVDPSFGQGGGARGRASNTIPFSPNNPDPFTPFGIRTPDTSSPRINSRRSGGLPGSPALSQNVNYGTPSPGLPQTGNILGMGQPSYNSMTPQSIPPHLYQAYMYQAYQQNPNMGTFHA